jgi:SPP1 gp7 family putative phage head morphogenesis protein
MDRRTNESQRSLEKRLRAEYRQASQDMQIKINDFLEQYGKENKRKQKQVLDGKLDKKEYKKWLERKAYTEKQLKRMAEVLTEDSFNTNKIAEQMINHNMPDVYALNMNMSTYFVESNVGLDTSFTLYNRDTVEYLMRDNPQLLRGMNVDRAKDMRWNRKRFNNAITQGILQGESIPDIAKRVQEVTGSNYKAAVRNARTATTRAQSRGRTAAFKRANDLGIETWKVWVATIDDRTRHSHVYLDGQERPVDEPFESLIGEIMEPGDYGAEPADVYNCRCTMIGKMKESEFDMSDLESRYSDLPDFDSYDEWKEWHEEQFYEEQRRRGKA